MSSGNTDFGRNNFSGNKLNLDGNPKTPSPLLVENLKLDEELPETTTLLDNEVSIFEINTLTCYKGKYPETTTTLDNEVSIFEINTPTCYKGKYPETTTTLDPEQFKKECQAKARNIINKKEQLKNHLDFYGMKEKTLKDQITEELDITELP